MATQKSTIGFILDQIAAPVEAKRMFGEYGLFCNGKMVAVVCDDQLFVKPTSAGRTFADDLAEASPFPGAKAYLKVNGDKWDECEWLTELIRRTEADLPAPKARKPKVARKP